MNRLLLGLALVSVGLLSCKDKEPSLPENLAVVDMSKEPSEVLLPLALWDELEKTHVGLYTQSFERERELDGKGLVKFYASLPLVVTMTSNQKGALHHEAYQLVYQDGGGTLDLSRFVKPQATGALRLAFDFPEEFKMSPKKVFFLSQAPKRTISGEIMGSGCGVFMDLTGFFEESVQKGGVELFLKDQRHLTVYGGTFFLATTKASQFFLAHLKITDSRYPELRCPDAPKTSS